MNRLRLASARLLWKLRHEHERRPLISVLIPTYNRADILTRVTVPTILGQSYDHFELIVVGDGITDETEAKLAAFGDRRIRFHNLAQRGVYPENPMHRWMVAGTAAANRSLELARGSWIAFSDDDDTWTVNHLEVLLHHARSSGAEFVYGAGMFQRSRDEWLRIGAYPPLPGQVLHSSVLYRSYLRVVPYDVEAWRAGIGGDAHRWGKLFSLGVRFSFVDQIICSSPLRPGEDLRGMRAAERALASWKTADTVGVR